MTDILDVQEKLQDTASLLARLKGEFARQPFILSLLWEIKSLEKRQERLQQEFLDVSATLGQDVCSYRIIPEEQLRITDLAAILSTYQLLVSVFYDALKRGSPKKNAKIDSEAIEKTRLDFSYAFAGSVGIVFSVKNQRDLFGDSKFSESLSLIAEICKAKLPDQILHFARQLGPAPIRILYQWANAHVKGLCSADIEWREGQEMRQKSLIQGPEFRQLQQSISQTSAEEHEQITVAGTLVGADVSSKTFHFRPDNGSDIKGSSGDIINHSHSVELPKRYIARVEKTTITYFSTEEEKVRHQLLSINPA